MQGLWTEPRDAVVAQDRDERSDLHSESVKRIIAKAIGWLIAALAASLLLAVALAVTLGMRRRVDLTPDARIILGHAVELANLGVMLCAAFIRARVVGQRSIRAGLGDGAISNRILVAGLAGAITGYALLVSIGLHGMVRMPSRFSIIDATPLQIAYIGFLGLCLGPVSEELFFRGWMWTGLRKRLDAFLTSLITGVAWLIVHQPKRGGRNPCTVASRGTSFDGTACRTQRARIHRTPYPV
jgi:membrane protease YdiL (CAAX protease family)